MELSLVQFKSHARYPASIQEEWDVLDCRVDMIIILELRKGEEIIPVILPLINEEAEELFLLSCLK